MACLVFHHTDAAHLPFILLDGHIRPSRRNPRGNPVILPKTAAEAVWFTTDHRCDRTSTAFRCGAIPPVRLTFPIEDTIPFEGLLQHGWTRERLADDEARGRRVGAVPAQWHVHVGPVAVDALLGVQIRHGNVWCDVERERLTLTRIAATGSRAADVNAVRVACPGLNFVAVQIRQPDGSRGYMFNWIEPETDVVVTDEAGLMRELMAAA